MMDFITVEQAEKIIQSHPGDYGTEEVSYEAALGRVLAENLFADRDLPPFNRSMMDGIAIQHRAFSDGIRHFKVKATQAAGEDPVKIENEDECVEIMTGAALHETADTVIRYEDITRNDGIATINIQEIKKGQSIHPLGKDRKKGERVADAGQVATPAITGLATSIGKTKLQVKKNPHVIIITTGDEMVGADTKPAPQQLRRSNDSTIRAALQQRYALQADTLHLKDDYNLIKDELAQCLQQYDVILMSGGVSMGKFDYVPKALEELSVEKLFHKVKQKPGKPFWFGRHENQAFIFAFPGNPVSTFLCLHRYFMPWLSTSLKMKKKPPEYAILQSDIHFSAPLQYFAQVQLKMDINGRLLAKPQEGHGSGDFVNLVDTDAFLELPLEKNEFKKGETFKVWRYSS
jgi:molybdopterin molybdotransferase